MQTLEAIAKRKSTRSYKPEKISEEALQIILKAGCAAPVAMGNYASLHFTVVVNPVLLDKINAAATQALLKLGLKKNADYGAKTMILVSSTPVHRPGTDHANAGIVIENMVLAATSIGIDSVVLGGPISAIAESNELKNAIGIPEGFSPLLAVALGYATEDAPAKVHTISVNRV